MTYSKHLTKTAQTSAVPGKNQVKNSAGGYVFEISNRERLKRFLILGAEGGTYYATEQKLTVENAENTIQAIKENGKEAVELIVNISENGRAAKNEPAIFALVLAMTYGDADTKKLAYDSIVKVCRTGTHLFTLCQYVQDLRGWSRGLRNGVAKFYNNRNTDQLSMQLIKYRQRNGWTHRDVLRLAHVKPKDADHNELFNYAVDKGMPSVSKLVTAFEFIQTLTSADAKEAVKTIKEFNLPWEALPTELLNSKEVWEALIPNMGMTALIRNLGKMTSIGVLGSNLDQNTKTVVSRLTDENVIRESKIHPYSVLVAITTYKSGHGFKGSLSWSPVSAITTALNKAFYSSFKNVEATGKNIYLGVDCSGSMTTASIGNSNVSACGAAAALAMLTVEKENWVEVRGFSAGQGGTGFFRSSEHTEMIDLGFTKGMEIGTACRKAQLANFGATDCALPILDATKRNLMVDCFIIYTDNETYTGSIHPFQALKEYRRTHNPNAKLIVVGMTSTGFSIADPSDKGMLDVVGFDSAAPELMNMFIKGEI